LLFAVRNKPPEDRDEVLLAFEVAARRIQEGHAEARELRVEHGMMNHDITCHRRRHGETRVARRDREPIGVGVDEAVTDEGSVTMTAAGVNLSGWNEEHGAARDGDGVAPAPQGRRAFVDDADRKGVVGVAVERVGDEAGLEELHATHLRDSDEARLVGVGASHRMSVPEKELSSESAKRRDCHQELKGPAEAARESRRQGRGGGP
jgi:hypothetical protein